MEPAIKVAIGALSIAIFTLIVAIINSVFIAKTYKKSRRLEFLQRRDHLSRKISDLNDKNNEAQMISARYKLVELKQTMLPLQGEQAEQNTALIASIKKQREGLEMEIKLWDERNETLQLLFSNLTLETHAPGAERMIAFVQVVSDNLTKFYSIYLSALHILETTNELTKTTLAKRDADIRQINLDADAKKRQINLDYERAIEKLSKKWQLSDASQA
ncbi:MAG: hypothetical protein ACSLE5_09940 [Porticoccaceae bacterium]